MRGPDSGVRRTAESTLIVCVDGGAMRRPAGACRLERAGIVVHAVDGDDDDLRLFGAGTERRLLGLGLRRGRPGTQTKPRPVEAGEPPL